MSKRNWTKNLPPLERRNFLKLLGAAVAAPTIPLGVRYAAYEEAVGAAEAEGLVRPPINYIEINLRDQWDFGHCFLPPGLATYANLKRGLSGHQCGFYYGMDELQLRGNNFYLTPGSMELERHLDHLAVIETCELSMGQIHGHEAANALRAPGRSYSGGPGRFPMYELDPRGAEGGNENHFTSTPTPLCLHNHHVKQNDPEARNAIALKMLGRNKHTVYHCAAGLPGAEPDRFQDKDALLRAFELVEPTAHNILPDPEQAQAVSQLLTRVDERFFERYHYSNAAKSSHFEELSTTEKLLHVGQRPPFSLALTPEEMTYWSEGVPAQVGGAPKANIWEQVAWAFKLINNNITNSVGLEFVYQDVHDTRPQRMMDTMMKQTVLPLTRLLDKLKEANLFERTLVAVYSTDGGRGANASSSGDEGKNTVLFAGGMIQGGYYGDVRVVNDEGDGHIYSYHAPDIQTGTPRADGAVRKERDKRLDGKHVWRTQMRALDVDDNIATSFPDTQDAQLLPWVLRET